MTCADVSVDELVQTVYLKIKQMKRELTLTDIAGYLPYGLKVQEAYQDIWTIRQLGNIDPCRDGDVGLVSSAGNYEQYTYIADIRPILRPMSDLYREITDKDYNGRKPFVPLVELAKARHPNFNQYILYPTEQLVFFSMHSNVGDYTECYDYYEDRISIAELDLLHQLKFDHRGLIDAGLAVSVHDLEQNPYEK